MEFCGGGTLNDHLRKEGLPEVTVSLWAAQIANALFFLQSQNILHRDLKPDNVAIT